MGNLASYADMIKYAAAKEKLERILTWLKNDFNSSEIWSNEQNEEISKYRADMEDALTKLIQAPEGSDKTSAIKLFQKAAHYETALTSGNFKSQEEIEAFVELIEWTQVNYWVINKVDTHTQIKSEDIPRWLISHHTQVIAIRANYNK